MKWLNLPIPKPFFEVLKMPKTKKQIQAILTKRKATLGCDSCNSIEKNKNKCWNAQMDYCHCPEKISEVSKRFLGWQMDDNKRYFEKKRSHENAN